MLENMFEEAKQASYTLMNVNTDVKDKALESIAKKLDDNRAEIKEINKKKTSSMPRMQGFQML